MFMPGRRLAMHLAVQPEIGEIMLSDPYLRAQGLLSRLLVIYPNSAIGTLSAVMRRRIPPTCA